MVQKRTGLGRRSRCMGSRLGAFHCRIQPARMETRNRIIVGFLQGVPGTAPAYQATCPIDALRGRDGRVETQELIPRHTSQVAGSSLQNECSRPVQRLSLSLDQSSVNQIHTVVVVGWRSQDISGHSRDNAPVCHASSWHTKYRSNTHREKPPQRTLPKDEDGFTRLINIS